MRISMTISSLEEGTKKLWLKMEIEHLMSWKDLDDHSEYMKTNKFMEAVSWDQTVKED